jgi:HTH-type transcriptional regulator/antitoxin HigA
MDTDVRPLRTEADYDWALAEIEPYFIIPPPLGTPGAEHFDVLAALIEAYEAHRWPIEPPDPVDAIRARMA